MHKDGYKQSLAFLEDLRKKNDDDFKMDHKTIKRFCKLVEALLGQKLEFEEYQALTTSDVEYFFEKLNELIINKFDLKDERDYQMNQGQQ